MPYRGGVRHRESASKPAKADGVDQPGLPRSAMLPKPSRVPGDLHPTDSTRGSMAWITPNLENRS
ncbi:hypothetical protein DPMN_162103 [Dreissena polymorpha]|uniref:Uncharacterized protein n=1 Tax=Dreissena polymorpha TaxID=45954 RepID=A0A9D4ETD7_DREPO|nr:hypothetical protein DPMN_162103 [Dreissena polymorpha]